MKVSRSNGWVLALAAAVLVVVLAVIGFGLLGGDSPPADSASGDPAADLYQRRCAACHGGDLQGGSGPALQPGSPAAARARDELRNTIANGRGGMPAFGDRLTPEEIDGLVLLITGG